MKKIIFIIMLSMLLLIGCNSDNSLKPDQSDSNSSNTIQIKKGIYSLADSSYLQFEDEKTMKWTPNVDIPVSWVYEY